MVSKYDFGYLKCAKNMSGFSNFPRVKIGCVVVNKHKIISSGYNSYTKTSTIQARLDKKHLNCDCPGKVHAETMALLPYIKSRANLSGATIYTYREFYDGNYALARPCERCMELIKSLGIKKIVYTTNDGVAKEKLYY